MMVMTITATATISKQQHQQHQHDKFTRRSTRLIVHSVVIHKVAVRWVEWAEHDTAQWRYGLYGSRSRLKCDGTRAETRFRLSAKRTSPFNSAGASVRSTTGSRGVRISGSNARYTMFRGSVKGTGYPLNSPVSPSLPLPCAISNAVVDCV